MKGSHYTHGSKWFSDLRDKRLALTKFFVNRKGSTMTGPLSVGDYIRSTGISAPASGAGVEIYYSTNIGYVIAYDRTGTAWKELDLDGNVVHINKQSGGAARIGGAANYTQFASDGNLRFVGTAALQFGSCYGNEIAWAQASAAQNTWYDISDADMVTGQLNGVTHDGNGKLTAVIAGRYAADWYGSFEADAANVHVQVTFSINGTETNDGMNHFETVGINRQDPCAGNAILDLAANDTVNVSIRTTDAGTPDLAIDHLGLRLFQIGG